MLKTLLNQNTFIKPLNKAIVNGSSRLPIGNVYFGGITHLNQRRFVQMTKPRSLYANTQQSEVDESVENEPVFKANKARSQAHTQEILSNSYPKPTPNHPSSNSASSSNPSGKKQFEDYVLPHPIWDEQELDDVEITHKSPKKFADWMAYGAVGTLRFTWDFFTGYSLGRRLGLFPFSYRMWLLRVVFLETVAGVPGMMFGACRHLNSLRRLERDRGWIITLLSEAENERIHLLTAMYLYKPGKILRTGIVTAQGLMCTFLFPAYLISPRFCHSFVGYLEEQAVHTYTSLLHDIDSGKYPQFEEPASKLAKAYWKLSDDATWKDVFANIRADESNHRDVNHKLAELAITPKAFNPFRNKEKE